MPFNTYVSRGDTPEHSAEPGVHPLIPEDVKQPIIKGVIKKPILKARKPKGFRRK